MTAHRDFIISLGGYRKVALRLGKPGRTVHYWSSSQDGRFPSYLYLVLCALADEAGVPRPGPELFRFLAVPPAPEERAAA